MLITSGAAMIGPPRVEMAPDGAFGVTCNPNTASTCGSSSTALFDHETRAVEALFAGLEHEAHGSGEVVASIRQHPRRAREHRGVCNRDRTRAWCRRPRWQSRLRVLGIGNSASMSPRSRIVGAVTAPAGENRRRPTSARCRCESTSGRSASASSTAFWVCGSCSRELGMAVDAAAQLDHVGQHARRLVEELGSFERHRGDTTLRSTRFEQDRAAEPAARADRRPRNDQNAARPSPRRLEPVVQARAAQPAHRHVDIGGWSRPA